MIGIDGSENAQTQDMQQFQWCLPHRKHVSFCYLFMLDIPSFIKAEFSVLLHSIFSNYVGTNVKICKIILDLVRVAPFSVEPASS